MPNFKLKGIKSVQNPFISLLYGLKSSINLGKIINFKKYYVFHSKRHKKCMLL